MGTPKFAFEIVALIASVLAILSFFSVKPLPKMALFVEPQIVSGVEGMEEHAVGPVEGADGQCLMRASADSVEQLSESVGQAVFVDLRIAAELWGRGTSDGSGCTLDPFNMHGSEIEFERPGGYFSHRIGPSFELEQTEVTGEVSVYEHIFSLELPNEPSYFTQVSTCEGHCYEMTGAVRIEPVSSSEGIFSIRLTPIDVYQNSHLTARYECRIAAESIRFEWLAPLYCGFS